MGASLLKPVPLLAVEHLTVAYDDVPAVAGISFEVHAGEAVAIIGSNGAGKTTTLNALVGLVRSRTGTVTFDGGRIDAAAAHDIHARGLILIPEEQQTFPAMTVWDNLMMGGYARRNRPGLAARVDESLALFPRLRERRRQPAGSLSGGEQRMLAIARALVGRPRLLLLDEPSTGLAPRIVDDLFDVLGHLRTRGLTCLLVEQNAVQALQFADRAYVLETGRIVHQGPAKTLLSDPQVASFYLGTGGPGGAQHAGT
ncbi:MAG TPA: ABC transporter ATP-binding protein [bacterium]|nr:ABC transporter ATP-binding protein [bacterium]